MNVPGNGSRLEPPNTPPSDERLRTPEPEEVETFQLYSVRTVDDGTLDVPSFEDPTQAAVKAHSRSFPVGVTPVAHRNGSKLFVGAGEGFEILVSSSQESSRKLEKMEQTLAEFQSWVRQEMEEQKEKMKGLEAKVKGQQVEIVDLQIKNQDLKSEIQRQQGQIDQLLKAHHRALECQRPILNAAIVKLLADELSDEKRKHVVGAKGKSGVSVAEDDGGATKSSEPFLTSVEIVRRAIKGPAKSRYHTYLASNSRAHYSRPEQLERFLKQAAEEHPGRAAVAHPNCSDEAILSLAFEVERAGIDEDKIVKQIFQVDRRPVTLIMEVIGLERTNAACEKLLKVIPVQVIDGRTRVSPLAPVTAAQLMMHVPLQTIIDF